MSWLTITGPHLSQILSQFPDGGIDHSLHFRVGDPGAVQARGFGGLDGFGDGDMLPSSSYRLPKAFEAGRRMRQELWPELRKEAE